MPACDWPQHGHVLTSAAAGAQVATNSTLSAAAVACASAHFPDICSVAGSFAGTVGMMMMDDDGLVVGGFHTLHASITKVQVAYCEGLLRPFLM